MTRKNPGFPRLLFVAAIAVAIGCAGSDSATDSGKDSAAASGDEIVVGSIEGAIGPVSMAYISRVIDDASDRGAECVVFTMDTPGGLDASMRGIIRDILSSTIPVVIFVHPGGSRAASAGAIIMLAAHVAVMAPSTNIGAAHPVSLGQQQMDSTMTEKVTNDAAAFARGLAKDRGRNTDWAERIVRESISSTAEEALELGVIDFIAEDLDDLIDKLDGREVEMDGDTVVLATASARVVHNDPSWREGILARIAHPNIAYLLLLAGIFGIFFELQNPGAILPGIVGAIAILLAFYSMQVLPVDYTGVALILLAVIMFILEVKVPSGGLLTVGGIVAMVIGSLMFIDSPLPFMRVSLSVIIPAVAATALFFLFAVGMGLRAQKRKVATGEEGIIGAQGRATSEIAGQGTVFVWGEHWKARSDEPIPNGSPIEVVAVNGMMLTVKRVLQKEGM